MTPIEQAWQGYIAAMEWTATVCRSDDPEGNDPEPLDHFDTEEVDHRAELWEGFADYFEQVAELLVRWESMPAWCPTIWDDWSQVGHDMWLTGAGHGAGFWDRYGRPKGATHFTAADLGDALHGIAKTHRCEHGWDVTTTDGETLWASA